MNESEAIISELCLHLGCEPGELAGIIKSITPVYRVDNALFLNKIDAAMSAVGRDYHTPRSCHTSEDICNYFLNVGIIERIGHD